MNITIFNAGQIGGCFTLIETGKANILIDYGQALPGSDEEQETFDWEKTSIDAVFITHYHGDHMGRIAEIPGHIPIYMGSVARQVMINIYKRLSKHNAEHLKVLEILQGDRIKEVEENKEIKNIPGMVVTPYSVDHSAYDAYMYLVEADGKAALHTGDFRGHGYRGNKMPDVIKYYVHKNGRQVDYLIIEGTMMGDRAKDQPKTEDELLAEATKRFSENKYAFLVISSTNLDSLSSFHRAARRFGMRTYCYSDYLCEQLQLFSETAGKRSAKYLFKDYYPVMFGKIFRKRTWKRTMSQEDIMRQFGFLCIIKPTKKYAKWIERFADKNPLVIYSLWNGYLNKNHKAYNKEWAEFFKPYQQSGQFVDLHTSGHADPKMIATIIEAVDPQEKIYPMHTEHAQGFLELDIREELKQRVEL